MSSLTKAALVAAVLLLVGKVAVTWAEEVPASAAVAGSLVAETQGLLGLMAGGPFTAETLNAIVAQVNAAPEEDRDRLAAAAAVLFSHALYAVPPAEASVEGETATVKLQARPLDLVLVLKDGVWQIDLAQTAAAMPASARKNATLLLGGLYAPPAEEEAAEPAADPVLELSDANFAAQVEQAQGLVMVDFFATWCGPCQAMKPVFHEFAAQNRARMKFGALDTDASPATARKYGIRAIPTVMVFQDGRKVAERVGFCSAEQLQAMVEPFLK
jgi:thioredoxin